MKSITKIDREKQTLSLMIDIYCRKQHHSKDNICDECQALKDYTFTKLEQCLWDTDKPTCKNCSIHCYSPERREEIRRVMRFSGPRMIFHPLHTLRHYFK